MLAQKLEKYVKINQNLMIIDDKVISKYIHNKRWLFYNIIVIYIII